MMRFLMFLALFYVFFLSSAFCQDNISSVIPPQITGEILKLIREDKEDWVIYETTIKFNLLNSSNRKLILLRDSVRIEGVEIFKNIDFKGQEVILSYDTPPSFSGNAKWIIKGEELWKHNTKSESLMLIDSDKSFSFEEKYTFGFPRENRIYGKGYLWADIKNEKTLFMKMKITLWEDELRTERFSSEIFPKKLASRINRQGILIFDEIISEPIPLDLSSAVIKN